MQNYNPLGIFFLLISVLMLIMGVLVLTGKYKRWWLVQSTPVTPIGMVFVFIPASFLFLVFSILLFLPIPPDRRGDIAMITLLPIMLLMLVIATVQPRWLKPKWLRWLETNHNDLIPLLHEDALHMGKREWGKRIETQEGLEEWANKVRRKNKLDHPDQRFIGNPHT